MAEVKIGDFLFERKGKYKPNDEAIQGLRRIEKIDFSGKFHIGDKSSKTNMILVKKGDLVISGINVAKGAMGIYTGDEDVVATIHYSSYTFDESKINVDYFKRFLKSAEFLRLLKEQIKGGIKTEIKPKHLLPLEIDLPDLEIQNEIVAKFEAIEDNMAILDNEIQTQQTLLKKLRQAILQKAIEGKLTVDWRVANPDVEPASALIEKIRAEKERLVKEKKIRKQKPLPPIEEAEMPFEIPESWEWCRLGDIFTSTSGGTPARGNPKYWDGDISWLKSGEMTDGLIINESEEKITENGLKESSATLFPQNTVLIAMYGATAGKLGILTFPSSTNQAVCGFYENSYVLQYYLFHFLKAMRNKIIEDSWGQSQPNISQTYLKNLTFPLPPLEEQKEIVKKIEKLFALCDALEAQIDRSKADIEALMQAVLREAFESGG